jgi:dihydrofolate reductase
MEAILAIDINNGLSKNGSIPWTSKKDMLFFYNQTKNNVIIMGKNTYFSIPKEKRPLKNRLNIVLTRSQNSISDDKNHKNDIITNNNVIFTSDDKIYESILSKKEAYFALYPSLSRDFKIYIIGGKQIYEKYIPICKTIWVTYIKKDYHCDLQCEFDFKKVFKENVVEEDNELKIVHYTTL